MNDFTNSSALDPAISTGGFQPLARRLRRLSLWHRRSEAAAFLDLFYDENDALEGNRKQRKAEVDRELNRHGCYTHTTQELAFGA